MDNQRLILFLIFSFSLVMLWEAWQKQGTPGQVANPPAVAAAAPTSGGSAAPVPVPTADTIPAAAAPVAAVDTAARLVVTTDLYVAEISAQGGDLTRLEFRQHRATEDKSANFVLFEAKHAYTAQGGLIGQGLPTHKTLWQLPGSGLEMKDDEAELRVRLSAPATDGVQVAKTYVFKRGSYLIDVEFEIANGGNVAITPHAYFQLTRDGQAPEGANAMMSTFTGPAFYTDAEKFQKVNFSDVALKEAKTALSRFYHSFKAYQQAYGDAQVDTLDETLLERFNSAMRDDFNTAEAIAVLFEVNKELNRAVKEQQAEQAAIYYATLRHLTNTLGLVQHNVEEFLKSDIGQEALALSEEQIEDLIQQRQDAKKAKEFAKADEIRQSLLDQGVVLEDTRQGTIWRRAD